MNCPSYLKILVCFLSLSAAYNISIAGLIDTSTSNTSLLAFLYTVDNINQDNTILTGHTLKPFFYNTACNDNTGLEVMLEMRSETEDKVMGIIGPTCSVVAEDIASVKMWNAPFISFSASSTALSDKELYPSFFRVVNSDAEQANAWLSMLMYYEIDSVALLYSSENVHFLLGKYFIDIATEAGIQVLAKIFPGGSDYDMSSDINEIKSSGINTILLACYSSDARTVFTIAKEYEITETGYTWIGSDSWGFKGVENGDSNITSIIQGFLVTVPGSEGSTTLDNWVTDFENTMNPVTDTGRAALVSDAVWAFANALDSVLNEDGEVFEETDNFRTLITQKLFQLEFQGITGPVSFDSQGNRNQIHFEIKNFQQDELITVATYTDESGFQLNGIPILFPGNYLSEDGSLPLPVIHIGSLIPGSGGWPRAPRMNPAFFMGISDINNRSSMLPNFRLVGHNRDSGCDGKVALDQFFDMYESTGEQIIAVVGAGCSVATEPLAQVAPVYGLATVSYGSTSIKLSDKASFPLFSRTVAPDSDLGRVWYDLTKLMGWTKVSTLSSNDNLYSLLTNEFLSLVFEDDEIEVLASEVFAGSNEDFSVRSQLETIKSQGGKIIFMGGYSPDLQKVLEEAHQLGLNGENGYQWILSDGIVTMIEDSDETFRENWKGLIGFQPALGEGAITDDFWNRIGDFDYPVEDGRYSWSEAVYDAVFAIGHALHLLLEVQKVEFEETFAFRELLALTIINSTDFEGVNGRIKIEPSTGDRLMRYRGLNVQESDGSIVQIGIFDGSEYISTAPILWNNGESESNGDFNAPADFIVAENQPINIYLGVVFMVLASIGIIACIFFLVTVVILREHKVFQAARVIFCFLILVSGICAYSTIFLFYFPGDISCVLLPYLVHLSLILSLGCILAKAYRVWRIFIKNIKKMKRVKIKDEDLLKWVGILFCVTLSYLLICSLANPYVATVFPDETLKNVSYTSCSLKKQEGILQYWPLLLIIFEVLLVLSGVFFAYKTRKVDYLYYNESSFIGLTIYNLLLTGAILMPISYFLTNQQQDANFAIVGSGILLNSTAVVGFLFISRIAFVFKDTSESSTETGSRVGSKGTSTGPKVHRSGQQSRHHRRRE